MILAMAVYIPFLRKIFYFESIGPAEVFIAFGAGALSIVWFEVVKKIYAQKGIELFGR